MALLARGDRGTVSMYTVLLTPSVLILAGLLFDGGLAIHARQRAYDIAEQAARVGANDIDQNQLRTSNKVVLNADACQQALTFLSNAYSGQIVSPDSGTDCQPPAAGGPQNIAVTVHINVKSIFLGILPGLSTFRMQGTASAHPDEGN